LKKQLNQPGERERFSKKKERRRTLCHALSGKEKPRRSFKAALLSMPNVGRDQDFAREYQIEPDP
jgi:hypothetical protein